MLGFSMILQLLTPLRQPLLTYFVWTWLRGRYHSPASAALHRGVWEVIGGKAMPLVRRVELLHKAVAFVQRWFLSRPGGAAP